jgi:hypothetical protein
MTSEPATVTFKLSNFRAVDTGSDATAYIGFLDHFATECQDMIGLGIDLLALCPGSSAIEVNCVHALPLRPIFRGKHVVYGFRR